MKRLLWLYPARWRRRYGEEVRQVLEDLEPMRPRQRVRMAWDLVSGAADAHLRAAAPKGSATGAALRRALIIAGVVWAGLTVEIVLSNVVFASTEDNDGASVLIAYLAVFAALATVGVLAARVTSDWRVFALAGGAAGVAIALLTIGTYVVVDNVFLGIVGQQQVKIDGLARSGFASMRTYINLSLLTGLVALSTFLGLAGAGLGVLGGHVASLRRTGSIVP
jgi:hypothetical protein